MSQLDSNRLDPEEDFCKKDLEIALSETRSTLEQHLRDNCAEHYKLIQLRIGYVFLPKPIQEDEAGVRNREKRKSYSIAWSRDENTSDDFAGETVSEVEQPETSSITAPIRGVLHQQLSKIQNQLKERVSEVGLADRTLAPFVLSSIGIDGTTRAWRINSVDCGVDCINGKRVRPNPDGPGCYLSQEDCPRRLDKPLDE